MPNSDLSAVTPASIPTSWVLLASVPGAVVIAAAISAQTYLSMLGHGHSFRGIFAWQLCCWVTWALAVPIVLRVGAARVHARRPFTRGWWGVVALGVGLSAAHVLLISELTVWFQPYVPVTTSGYRQAFLLQLGSLLPIDLVCYATLLGAGMAIATYHRARQLEVLESQLQGDLARAQLEALRLEIQPHFLFNTLNAITALMRSHSNDRAIDMLVGLADLMHQTLGRTGEQVVSLSREMELTARYVDLQKARYQDRLRVEYDVRDECRDLMVPTFALQPLVENALRHGMGRQGRCLRVQVGARLEEDGHLHLWVSDDGVGLPSGFDVVRDARTGLGNTRLRLRRLYGAHADLVLRPRAEGGVVADIVIPADRPRLEVSA
ncbi:MAG: histidine kinase [Acidobacteriaceae bacterium]|jgi:two-component sensor histidine kinase|nr:histidine kinase [Acidobacteriaceae bacterium]